MRNSLVKDTLRELRRRIGKEIHDITVKDLVIGFSYTGVRFLLTTLALRILHLMISLAIVAVCFHALGL